jgi:hypothetical protein
MPRLRAAIPACVALLLAAVPAAAETPSPGVARSMSFLALLPSAAVVLADQLGQTVRQKNFRLE